MISYFKVIRDAILIVVLSAIALYGWITVFIDIPFFDILPMYGRYGLYLYYCSIGGIIGMIWWFVTDKNFNKRYKKK